MLCSWEMSTPNRRGTKNMNMAISTDIYLYRLIFMYNTVVLTFLYTGNFIVHVTGTDTIMLQSAQNTGRWLTILNNKEVSARVSECSQALHEMLKFYIELYRSLNLPSIFLINLMYSTSFPAIHTQMCLKS